MAVFEVRDIVCEYDLRVRTRQPLILVGVVKPAEQILDDIAAAWATMAFAVLGDAERAWELFTMIDPVNHAKSPDAIAVYKTETYVLASDVYALAPHTGRGGWTWYTGSAGWMYQFILESLLGLKLEADRLVCRACPRTGIHSKCITGIGRRSTTSPCCKRPLRTARPRLTIDGVELPGPAIPMIDDRRQHAVEVRIHVAQGRRRSIVQAESREERHNQPPPKPARRKPLAMYGQFRINRHNKPVR